MSNQSNAPNPREEIPWLRELDSALLASGTLASIREAVHFGPLNSVAVVSDYGGEHPGSDYVTYSFLFAAFEALHAWHDRIVQLKQEHFPDERTIEYKKLGDRLRQEALPAWLSLAGRLPGSLVTVAIQKEIDYLFLPSEGDLKWVLEAEGFAGYSLPVARKLIRILHFLCYFASHIFGAEQRVFWHTDRDSISGSGNDALLSQLGMILSRIARLYFSDLPEHMGYSDGLNEPDRLFKDALSLPDLTAGVLADKFTHSREESAHGKSRESILRWIADEEKNLRHLIIRFDSHSPAPDGTRQFVPKLLTLHCRAEFR